MIATADKTTSRGLLGRLRDFLRPHAAVQMGYDATVDGSRRRSPSSDTRAEYKVLDSSKRRKLIGTAREAVRNYVTAAWMIRCHLDYVSRFNFQSRTGDETLDTLIEDYIWRAGLRRNFDVAGRWSRERAMRVSEARRVLDGDVFWAKLSGGRVQMIEADRIRNPRGTPPGTNIDPADFTDGVKLSAGGRMVSIAVHKRTAGGGYEFERELPARHVWQHACWDTTWRVDQIRGISPLAPGLNHLADIYEGIDLAMAKAKVAQMFGMIIFRDAVEQAEGFARGQQPAASWDDEEDSDGDGTPDSQDEDADTERYDVDPGAGPFMLELHENDKAQFLSTNTPETELVDALKFVTDLALKALDIPYSFYDTSHANYYGRKADIQQYEASARSKRDDNVQLLDEWTAWRLRVGVVNGDLELPAGVDIADLVWEHVPTGMPWVDKLRDMKADAMAIDRNLDSELRAARRSGNDAYEIARERMDFERWLIDQRKSRELPPLAAGKGDPNVTDDQVVKGDDNA